jgi:hypothetical protein
MLAAVSIELDATASPEAALDVTATAGGGAVRGREHALEAGDLLAHFRIDRRLGAGGMGEVWLATDLALDRPVAIKVLPASVAGDASRRERLFREARAQARIQHPNVCHIYYVGEERGLVFFAMEYVAGESLAERIARGPVPAEEAVEIVRMAALGLREAHRHGFTHRDVKPSNLMVDAHGLVKVVDFGLVTRGEFEAERDGRAALTVTETALVGTPLYMAPEQARGESVDFRADIYALGATLHHLVAGRPPFEGQTAADLISQHADRPRPMLTATSRRLGPLDQVLARMMAKTPVDRHPSYDGLVHDLEAISPTRTRPAGLFARGSAAAIDALILLLGAALIHEAVDVFDYGLVFLAVCAAYTILCIARWGVTPGRALFDIEVVDVATGRPPSMRRTARRWLVQWAPFAVGVAVAAIDDESVTEQAGTAIAALGSLYGAGALGYAALRDAAKRPPWDRSAGTQVRYRRGAP